MTYREEALQELDRRVYNGDFATQLIRKGTA